MTDQASDFSIVSGLTNASKHCFNDTLVTPRPVGIGSDKYMNVLYVVEVWSLLSARANELGAVNEPACTLDTATDS